MKFNLENPPYYVPSKSDLLKDFDENITAPMAGYSNAAEYYRKCSSIQTSSNVKIPVLILSSSDDPIVDHSYLSITQKNPNLEHLITNQEVIWDLYSMEQMEFTGWKTHFVSGSSLY